MTDKELLQACHDFIMSEWARLGNQMTNPMNLLIGITAAIKAPGCPHPHVFRGHDS